MSKYKITEKDFLKIKDFAMDAFKAERKLPDDSKDVQVYLILLGLEHFLKTKNVEVGFEIEKLSNSEQIHLMALDDM